MTLNNEIKEYWEGEAGVYSQGIQEELSGPQRQAWKKMVLGNAPQKEVLDILDAGCGPGFFPVILSEEGHRVTGIDITENMIACAKENLEIQGQQAKLMTMDCQRLDFADNSFDLVICRNITWTYIYRYKRSGTHDRKTGKSAGTWRDKKRYCNDLYFCCRSFYECF